LILEHQQLLSSELANEALQDDDKTQRARIVPVKKGITKRM
jgi:hypothetical protein